MIEKPELLDKNKPTIFFCQHDPWCYLFIASMGPDGKSAHGRNVIELTSYTPED